MKARVNLPTTLRTSSLVLLAAMAALLTPGFAHAAKIPLGEGPATLNVNILAQPWVQLSKGGAPAGGMGTDFYLRRIRLFVFGNVTERISFFMDTDQANLGRDGNWDPAFYIQDAFLSVKLTEGPLWIDTGMLLAPFSRQSLQGIIALNTLDYHSSLLRFTQGVGKIWRDAGVQVRGLSGPLHYRVGIFNGLEGRRGTDTAPELNPDDVPRVAAHVRYNFLGTEDTFLLNGIYFADPPRLSVGVGTDYQPRSALAAGRARDVLNVAADLFLDYPTIPDQELVFQVGAFRYWQGRENTHSGFGMFGELGYRVGIVEPVFSTEYFNADVAHTDFLAFRPGFNLWLMKQTFNLKAEVGIIRQQVPATPTAEATTTTSVAGTAQLQLFY
jgi:hypothetical protein